MRPARHAITYKVIVEIVERVVAAGRLVDRYLLLRDRHYDIVV